jgi:hypothetical protein
MRVYILTLRENNEGNRLLKNLGVFSKRSLCMEYLILNRTKLAALKTGSFKYTSVQELKGREVELDFKHSILEIFKNGLFIAYAEESIFM